MFNTNHPDPLKILASTRWLIEKPQFVFINQEKLEGIIPEIKTKLTTSLDDYSRTLGSLGKLEEDVQLIFIEGAINFCYWPDKDQEKWTVEWPKGNVTTGGFFSLVNAFKRILEKSRNILDAEYLAGLTFKEAQELFRGKNNIEIPLLPERVKNLNEAGRVLLENFNGQFIHALEEVRFEAIELVNLLCTHFPGFRDSSILEGKEIFFLKRAQLVPNDLSHLENYHSDFQIKSLEKLATLADYRLPQILEHFGVLSYTPELAQKIFDYELIPSGSKAELEIRASTIWAVELIRQKMNSFSTQQIDNAIWLIAQELRESLKPHHRTRTIFY